MVRTEKKNIRTAAARLILYIIYIIIITIGTRACEQNGFRIMSFINLFVYAYDDVIYCFSCLRWTPPNNIGGMRASV